MLQQDSHSVKRELTPKHCHLLLLPLIRLNYHQQNEPARRMARRGCVRDYSEPADAKLSSWMISWQSAKL
jgi:hypothetical protein